MRIVLKIAPRIVGRAAIDEREDSPLARKADDSQPSIIAKQNASQFLFSVTAMDLAHPFNQPKGPSRSWLAAWWDFGPPAFGLLSSTQTTAAIRQLRICAAANPGS